MKCHEPPNGGALCIQLDRIEDLEGTTRQLNERIGGLTDGQADIRKGLTDVGLRVTGMGTDVRETKEIVGKILKGVTIGNIRAEPTTDNLPDWVDEDTGIHDVSAWSTRAKQSAVEHDSTREENARLQATLDEMLRQKVELAAASDRKWKRYKVVGGGIVSLIVAAGTVAAAIYGGG